MSSNIMLMPPDPLHQAQRRPAGRACAPLAGASAFQVLLVRSGLRGRNLANEKESLMNEVGIQISCFGLADVALRRGRVDLMRLH